MTRPKALLASLLLAAGVAQAEPVAYQLDASHTVVLASWSHLGFSHPVAHFGDVEGTLVYDADDVAASSVEVKLPMSGLQSFQADFNKNLAGADFFDAARWPNATFKSTGVEKIGATRLKVTGDLTLRDVTKPVVLDVTLNKIGRARNGQPAIGFDGVASIKRSDFGLGKYVPDVSDKVEIRISTEAVVPRTAE